MATRKDKRKVQVFWVEKMELKGDLIIVIEGRWIKMEYKIIASIFENMLFQRKY